MPTLLASITDTNALAPTRAPNETAQLVVTIAAWVLAIGVIVWAARMARREKSWLPITVILAIWIAVINEPLFDKAFHLYFYDGGKQWSWLDTYGYPQPNWTGAAYMILYGIPALLMMQRIRTGKLTRQWLWKYFVAAAIFVGCFESIAIYAGTYTYFGDHPFMPGKYPLWLAVMEGAHDVVFAMLIAVFAPVMMKGWKVLMPLPLFLISFCSVMFGAGFLGLTVVNADPIPTVVVYLGAIASMGLACVMVYLVSLALPSEKPNSGRVPAFLRSMADRLSTPVVPDAPTASSAGDAPRRDRELVPSGD